MSSERGAGGNQKPLTSRQWEAYHLPRKETPIVCRPSAQRSHCGVVSVTQAFDTSTATGKLMMHILMSFAEFERQLISERTRDKIAASRRRGKWSGGMPVLGYDVVDTKLVVNQLKLTVYVKYSVVLGGPFAARHREETGRQGCGEGSCVASRARPTCGTTDGLGDPIRPTHP